MSLINALLPLPEGGEVTDIEYLTPELMPETPFGRNSIVDVRCKDARGRQFLVEMQTVWTEAFMTACYSIPLKYTSVRLAAEQATPSCNLSTP